MNKKLPVFLLGMATAGALAALGLVEAKENIAVPKTTESVGEVTRLTEIGNRKSVPMRVPEGGYTAPVTFAPTQEQFNECSIIDVNEDGKKWHFENGGYFKYDFSLDYAADDWCILPTMNLEAGTYKVTFTYKTRTDKENFKLCIGNSTDPESMTITLFEKTEYSNSTEVTESRTVELTTGGEWHIGLYAFSPVNKFGIYFKNISVVKLDMNQPKAPELSAKAVGLDCTLTLTLPTETLGGSPLTASTVSADVYLDGEPIEGGSVSGAPGEVKTLQFSTTSGSHSISATATVTEGENTLTSESNVIDMKFTKIQPKPIPMGYTFEPDADEFEWCTVIDNNNDNSTWNYGNSGYPTAGVVGEGTFRYSYSYSKDADDYIVLPAFDGTETGAKKLTFSVATKYDLEGMEVCMAYEPTVEALSQNVIWKQESFKYPDSFERQEVIFPTEGGKNFYIAFHAISPKYKSYIYVQNISVDVTDGSGPQAGTLSDPTFDGGDGTVTLTLPSKNLNGDDMTGTVYADITLDGEPYGEPVQGTPGQKVPIEFTELPLGAHTVTATTFILNDQSEKIGNQTTSIEFKCRIPSSFAYQLPVSIDLKQNVYDNFLVVNANNDDKTWTGEADCFQLSYTSNSGDDWFISPAVEINDISTRFDIAVTAKNYSTNYGEAFEVFIGREQSVEGMTIKVIDRTEVTSGDWSQFVGNFELTEPGRYYIGVHGVSDPNMYNLMINKLEMTQSEISNDAPGSVTEIVGDGLETGELKAAISFKFPTTTVGGTPLDQETALTATVFSTTETKTVEGKPGDPAEVTISCPEGRSRVTIYVTSEAGESMRVPVEVNCGLDRPTAPVITVCEVSEDNMSLHLEWEPITTGVTGGHVNPDGMDYYLFEWDSEDEDWYQVDVTEGLTMTFSLDNPNQPLTFMTLGLQAYNGLNSGSAMTPITVVLGKPETLPMTETFEQGKLHHTPLSLSSTLDAEYAPEWSVVNPSTKIDGVTSEEGGYSLYGHTSFNRGDSFIGFPKFSTENFESVEIELSIYYFPSTCEFSLLASGFGMDTPVELGSITIPQTNEGWKKFKFELPEQLIGQKWVDTQLYVNFKGGSSCIPLIDSYAIRSVDKSSVENVETGLSAGTVTGTTGAILFHGFDNETARVFTPAGQHTATVNLSGSTHSLPTPAGIYVITVADKTFKVAVK